MSGVTSTTPPSLYVPRTRTSDTNIQLHEIIKCCHAEYILSLHDSLRSAYRFRSLSDPRVWSSAVTNGIFVRFGNVELSHDELLSMAEQEH